jgi:hypothetical protein
MPWVPRYSEGEARAAIAAASTWKEALDALGCSYLGKNVKTLRKWAVRWGIPTDHLPTGRSGAAPRYTEEEAAEAVRNSRSWAETLRRLGYCSTGANARPLKKRLARWGISTTHFDPSAASREALRREATPLREVLVRSSTYSRSSLKRRLFESGLKERACELCGQGEIWRGKPMGLILDHINGIRDDNRLENLRIVCPNCAATLDTHCGRKGKGSPLLPLQCARCETEFRPRYRGQRYCSRYCGSRWERTGKRLPGARKVERPSHERLLSEIEKHGYLGVGRIYGVSDNAIRKWIREYEREQAIAEGRDPDVIRIPTRTWPNRRRDRKAA